MHYNARRHGPWLSIAVLGITLVAAGLFMVVRGSEAWADIERELSAEEVMTSGDAAIPGVLVTDAATARAQADVIKEHTLGRWGPYSSLDREDPRRASFIDGVALRSALNMAVMGFALAELAIGAGIIILIAGAATLLFAVPTLHILAGQIVPKPSD
ncbi:MAG: hypothetical protein OXF44_00320 [Anaerolineaceae bacterium]|nr:hypothetical protein [Anaerolineaceae bacterium]MCY4023342.1 hypothetical protein [Anaerolineaceae bacterium]